MASPLPRKKIKSLTLHIHGLLFLFLVSRDMLNKFHLRYTAFIVESRDWRPPIVFEIFWPSGGPLAKALALFFKWHLWPPRTINIDLTLQSKTCTVYVSYR